MTYRMLVILMPLMLAVGGCHSGGPEPERVDRELVTVEVQRLVEAVAATDPNGRAMVGVPSDAVFMKGQLEGVQVSGTDNVVAVRWIRTGRRYGDIVEVLSGLEAGEKVIAPYDAAVREGYKVIVKQ
ncbi:MULTISPECIES: hypothetical protein [Prosthecochloris]|uniref:Multidrug resistance protein MdtA-like C-terminal permuted SH3 domain-containing protein n=1 Tax=Prosthecochloris aestuarii (strain DSM 271 / SK 413) TaxID=290512 RepID=B4S3V4_PROA2|nr:MULTISPECIES: hypothetical protein [Prosthecochloris]ACF45300.1 conserved hypothetical protein [Prosthecochloris aestuarii DSM 271]